MLWGRAAGRCSHPECRIDLYEDETETDDPTLVGENCHMVAESDDGPRADPSVPVERRNSYNNLILLCRNHHKVIDAQEGEYTLTRLRTMKANHEQWVREQLGFDTAKQKDVEYYADVVDKREKMIDLDNWSAWTSWILGGGQPSIEVSMDDNIRQLRPWILARVWPGRYPELENAFKNFLHVANDFYNCFHEHAEKRADDYLQTRKFYQIDQWDEKLYAKLASKFEHHVDLVQDLMLELTRAANLVCDRIRRDVMPSYRLAEGRLLVESGPTMDLKIHKYVVQYSAEERAEQYPYPGRTEFLNARIQRDLHFGEGSPP
jgi:hypothetical protein